MKRIGIDLDGVLADFNYGLNTLSKQEFGTPEDVTFQPPVWSITESLGLTSEQEGYLWRLILASKDFWFNLPALAGAKEAIAKVALLEASRKLDVYFITHRPADGTTLQQSERWLMKHGFIAPRVITATDKGKTARALRLDYFIDDRDQNCADVKAASPATSVFLVRYEYNKSMWTRPDFTVVDSFAHAIEIVEPQL